MSELRIMEYQGKYRIESGRQDGDKWWADRIRKKVWNKEAHAFEIEDKDRNLSMPLGDLESAKAILTDLELMLQTEKEQPPQEDVPF